MNHKKDKTLVMTEGNPYRLMITFALPLMLGVGYYVIVAIMKRKGEFTA